MFTKTLYVCPPGTLLCLIQWMINGPIGSIYFFAVIDDTKSSMGTIKDETLIVFVHIAFDLGQGFVIGV